MCIWANFLFFCVETNSSYKKNTQPDRQTSADDCKRSGRVSECRKNQRQTYNSRVPLWEGSCFNLPLPHRIHQIDDATYSYLSRIPTPGKFWLFRLETVENWIHSTECFWSAHLPPPLPSPRSCSVLVGSLVNVLAAPCFGCEMLYKRYTHTFCHKIRHLSAIFLTHSLACSVSAMAIWQYRIPDFVILMVMLDAWRRF